MRRKILILATTVFATTVAISAWVLKKQDENPNISVSRPQNLNDVVAAGGEDANSSVNATRGWSKDLSATRSNQHLDSIVARFKGANDCLLYHGLLRDLDSMLSDDRWNDLSGRTPETLKNMDSSSERSIRVLLQLEATCKDSDERLLISEAREAVFEAALKGSHDAQACFVIFGPAPWQGPGYPVLAPIMDRYLKHAPEFTNLALENGDPIVAARALHRYIATPPSHPSEIDDLPKADPILMWRAARLASLRAQPQQRALLERDLTEFAKQRLISATDIVSADGWAKETFDRYFAGQAPINLDFPTQCYSSPGLAP